MNKYIHLSKSLFLILMLFGLASQAKADYWDALTSDEAQSLLYYLEENPYLVDYCDVCDDMASENRNPAFLIKVKNPLVVPCHWDEERWSVHVEFEVVAWGFVGNKHMMQPAECGSELLVGIVPQPIYTDDDRYFLTMNYHWTVVDGQVSRLCFPIGYSNTMDNGGFVAFPDPNVVKINKVRKAYAKWLAKA